MTKSRQQVFAEALAEMADTLAQVTEACVGYRASCEAHGFSPTAAEAMALEYHALLVAMLTNGIKANQGAS